MLPQQDPSAAPRAAAVQPDITAVRAQTVRAEEQPRRRISPKSPRQAIQPEIAPPPPQRSQKAKHPLVVVLNFFLMIVVLVTLAAGAAVYFGKLRYTSPGPLTEPKSVSDRARLGPGDHLSVADAAADYRQRLPVLDGGTALPSSGDQLKAGEYLFEPGVSMEEGAWRTWSAGNPFCTPCASRRD